MLSVRKAGGLGLLINHMFEYIFAAHGYTLTSTLRAELLFYINHMGHEYELIFLQCQLNCGQCFVS